MSVSYLPAQAEWPDYLFRVTSSLTFGGDNAAENEGRFMSPVQQLEHPHEVTLKDAIPPPARLSRCRSEAPEVRT
jgi:hypothetical protein